MSELLRFFKDMRDNGYGLAEIAAQLGTSAIAEPVAGFAAMYDPVHGADAIREGMTYQPRTQEAQQYSQSIGNAAKTAIKPAMPIIDTWKQGVDIAGQYSPVVGASLRTVPTAIGIAMGAKPALQAGRQVSEGLGAMQGRMIANATAPSTLNTAAFRGQRGVFAGINALTADKEALAKAQDMIARGVDPEDVWQETGWGRGADGKWRFEINDSGSSLNMMNFPEAGDAGITSYLPEFLKHPQVYQNYPESKTMGVLAKNGYGDSQMRGGINGLMVVNSAGGDTAKSTVLHELQHAIQQKEGFASGGSPSQFDGLYNNPHEAYRRLGGEVEARMVQNRMDLTPEQRRDTYPFAIGRYGYEDIPKNEQIITFGNNKAMSQRPLTEFEQAHLLAQQRAALPFEQGGLGLPADNTPMDRAKAMGGIEGVHYSRTGADVQELDSGKYAISPFDAIGTHIGSKEAAAQRFNTTRIAIEDPKGVSYPVVMLGNKELRNKDSQPMSEDALVNDLISRGAWDGTDYHKKNAELRKRYFSEYDRIPYINDVEDAGKVSYIVPPKNIRSRFAAFDPFNRDSSNLLATTAPLVPTTALGAYMYNEKRKKSQGKQ